ncbi:MAG: hypothetical protein ACREA0_04405 [bacterium]
MRTKLFATPLLAFLAMVSVFTPAAHAAVYSVPYPVCNVSLVQASTSGESTSGFFTFALSGGNAYAAGCNGYSGFVALAVDGSSSGIVAVALGDGTATATALPNSDPSQPPINGVAIGPLGYAHNGNVNVGCYADPGVVSSEWCPFVQAILSPYSPTLQIPLNIVFYTALEFPDCGPGNAGEWIIKYGGAWQCKRSSLTGNWGWDLRI